MTERDEERARIEAQRAATLAELALTLDQRAVLERITQVKKA